MTEREDMYAHLSKLITPEEASKMINDVIAEHDEEVKTRLHELCDMHFFVTSNMNKAQFESIIDNGI